MAKGSQRSNKVQVQKGPISLKEQYTQNFMGRPQCMMEDLERADLRRSGQTLTFHEPKK